MFCIGDRVRILENMPGTFKKEATITDIIPFENLDNAMWLCEVKLDDGQIRRLQSRDLEGVRRDAVHNGGKS
jgi:hypothetical protein